VGLYTSPHLHDVRERITVNQVPISKRSLASILTLMKNRLDVYGESRRGFATFFDLLTAAAFVYFQREKVDVAVIETGLGGRLDATNVLHPEATIITHLSLEHTDKLGDTLEKIAAEKLAISHPSVPCIIAPQVPQLLPFIRKWLRERGVPARFVQKEYEIHSQPPVRWRRSIVISGGGRNRQIRLRLLGACQPQNAAAVCAIIDARGAQWGHHASVSEQALRTGLENTVWPGRFEILPRRDTGRPVDIVLDVAHTERGAASLRQSLTEVFGNKPRIMLLGFLRGKNILGIARQLVRRSDTLICTTAPSPRAVPVDELRHVLLCSPLRAKRTCWIDDPLEALQSVCNVVEKESLLVVAGSLYLVGFCRGILMNNIRRD
jgi:dihydrofolate synthase/folylpolyglutamate synthase